MASLSDVLTTVQSGVTAINDLATQVKGSFNNIAAQIAAVVAQVAAVGEFVSSSVAVGSAVGISTGTATNITSIALTAGDWDVNAIGLINPNAATNVSVFEASISSTSATRNSSPGFFSQLGNLGVVGSVYLPTNPIPNARFNLAAPATIYLVAFSTFSVSTNAAFGMLRARRIH